MLRRVLLIALVPCLQMACSSTPPAPSPAFPVFEAEAASSTPGAAPLPRGDRAGRGRRCGPSCTPRPEQRAQPRAQHLFRVRRRRRRWEYGALIDRHARYLLAHPDLKVTLQGNTDERGGTEYNLSLGQRRAQAVKSALHLLGVPDDQAEPVSFGEERPMADGHDEAAWAQNRRVDIVYMR